MTVPAADVQNDIPEEHRRKGPDVGQPFPDIRLPNQIGTVVDLHEARAGRAALVVFYRSARWWPYCKTQLVELQGISADLARANTALFAISYDSVETLAGFAAKHGITFPLLADEGSRTITELGMLDEDLDRHHAEFGRTVRDDQRGVAYPAVFRLDRDGIVIEKRFHRNYRIRDTGTGLLEAALGIAAPRHGPDGLAEGEPVRVSAHFDSSTYRPYQQLRLTVELAIRDRWHVYAAPVPTGYVALGAEIAPLDGLEPGTPTWPAGHGARVAGLAEEFSVLDGVIRGTMPVTFAVAAGRGDLQPEIAVHYQACSEESCLPPATVRLSLLVREAPFPEWDFDREVWHASRPHRPHSSVSR
jgi:peroxiredoxin